MATRETSLSILSLNTHKGFAAFNRRFTLPALRDAIRAANADVAMLQEVIGSHSGHAENVEQWPDQPQYEYLADTIWSDYAYGRNAVHSEGHHGNAILSKRPILQWSNHDVSIRGPEQRGVLHCVLDVPNWPQLHLCCIHLSLTELHRRRQLKLIGDIIRHKVPKDAALIVAGDFNDWWVNAHQILHREAGLKEAFVSLHGKAARSFPAAFPLLRLDRIYLRNLQPVRAEVLQGEPWSRLSDHAGLLVEVRP